MVLELQYWRKSKVSTFFVSDKSPIKDKYKEQLNKRNIPWEEGQHTAELILNADEVIKSPGIPKEVPMVKEIVKHNIPIISEIEFAGRYTNSKMICITGSNGKTTTTSLIYHIFKEAGYDVSLAGNIGKALLCRLLRLHMHTISSRLARFSSTICMISVPTQPFF